MAVVSLAYSTFNLQSAPHGLEMEASHGMVGLPLTGLAVQLLVLWERGLGTGQVREAFDRHLSN